MLAASPWRDTPDVGRITARIVRRRAPLGQEALIRGPEGSPWEAPGGLFAAASAGAVDRLELACRRAIFSLKQEPARVDGLLFVNVNPRVSAGADGLTEDGDARPVSPEEVLFELSEQQALADDPKVRRFVETLRRHGHRIVLDDFGAGYANLKALLELEPHGLKLHRQLVFNGHADQRRQITPARQGLGLEDADGLSARKRRRGIPRPLGGHPPSHPQANLPAVHRRQDTRLGIEQRDDQVDHEKHHGRSVVTTESTGALGHRQQAARQLRRRRGGPTPPVPLPGDANGATPLSCC